MIENVLSMRIEDLELSIRSYNCLKRAGYDTVRQLCDATKEELCSVRNLGRKASEEVFQKLLSLGLCPKKETHTCETALDENNNHEENNIECDEIIKLNDDFELSETNSVLTSDIYCDSTNCDFKKVCSLDKTYCVKKYFDAILRTLTPREEKVLKLYYGIGYERRKTSLQIGEELHVAREQILKIKKKALRKLRHKSRGKFIKALFPTIFATTKDTPYSRLTKKIFELEESNSILFRTEVLYPVQKECIENAQFDKA